MINMLKKLYEKLVANEKVHIWDLPFYIKKNDSLDIYVFLEEFSELLEIITWKKIESLERRKEITKEERQKEKKD